MRGTVRRESLARERRDARLFPPINFRENQNLPLPSAGPNARFLATFRRTDYFCRSAGAIKS
jgi:hypothetical protein